MKPARWKKLLCMILSAALLTIDAVPPALAAEQAPAALSDSELRKLGEGGNAREIERIISPDPVVLPENENENENNPDDSAELLEGGITEDDIKFKNMLHGSEDKTGAEEAETPEKAEGIECTPEEERKFTLKDHVDNVSLFEQPEEGYEQYIEVEGVIEPANRQDEEPEDENSEPEAPPAPEDENSEPEAPPAPENENSEPEAPPAPENENSEPEAPPAPENENSEPEAPPAPEDENSEPEAPSAPENENSEPEAPPAPEDEKAELMASSIEYQVNGGNIYFDPSTHMIINCDVTVTSAYIPESINGYSVTGIGTYAFYSCYLLQTVTLPTTIKSIGKGAFGYCSRLTSITVPYGVTEIGDYTFRNCSALSEITLPTTLSKIGMDAFFRCDALANVNYTGTGAKWNNISIGSGNSSLTNAQINYIILWQLYNDTLIITGSGKMQDYSSGDSPFYERRSSIRKIKINEGMTSVGDYAFYSFSNLTSVSLPYGLTSIGYSAFDYCTRLASINLPASLKSIESFAFYNCSSLSSISLPSTSLTSIGSFAFDGCSSISSLTIPKSVTSIGNGAFSTCSSLKAFSVASGSTTFSVNDGVLFDYQKKRLIQYPAGKSNTEYSIPSGVTQIGSFAFCASNKLTSVTISDNVTAISNGAFYDCENLESVVIPESVTSIGRSAFTGSSKFTTVYYTGTQSQWQLISISESNDQLLSATIEYNAGYTKGICGENLKWALKDGTLTITGSGNMYDYSYNNSPPWEDSLKDIRAVVIGEGVTSIGEYAFRGYYNLETVSMLYDVKQIGTDAFLFCSSLESVSLPNSLEKIDSFAFHSCGNLKRITFPSNLKTISSYAFADSGLTSVTIPANVATIGNGAFNSCDKLTSITVSSSNRSFSATDNVLFNAAKTKLLQYPGGKTGTSYTVPGTVSTIGTAAFSNNRNLSNVIMQYGLKSIGSMAFYCSNIKTMTIPSTVTSIDSYAFEYCNSLTDIYFGGPESQWNSLISEVTAKDLANVKVTYDYNDNTHGSCGNNMTWRLSESTLYINGSGKMYDYNYSETPWYELRSKIKSVVISPGVTSVGDCAFDYCTYLESAELPDSITSIGYSAFEYCQRLQSLSLPSGLTDIESWAFYRCSMLPNITLPSRLSSIGSYAFAYCNSLTSVNVPASLTYVGGGVFSGCAQLSAITVAYGNSVFSASNGILFDINKKKLIQYPAGKTGSSYTVPSTVTSIASSAFNSNHSLTNVVVTDNVQSLSGLAFDNCSNLSSVTLPFSITSIGVYAFSGCSKLSDVYYGGSSAQWQKISIESGNESLSNATIHYTEGYTVFFNANGGAVDAASKTVSNNSKYGTLPVPEREGFNFKGWFTSSEGGTRITSETVVSLTGDQTLYAHWEEIVKTFTVTFDPNGGTVETKSKQVTNGGIYGTLPTPTLNGSTFTGWYTGKDTGDPVSSNTPVSLEGNQTLYARWRSDSQSNTVTFNPNGGTVGTPSKVVQYNELYGTLPEPERRSYNFIGWYTSPEGGSRVRAVTTVKRTSDETLYAHWELKAFKVTFDPNGGSVDKASTLYVDTGEPYGILPVPVRNGYTFDGWYTEAGGGEQVTSATIANIFSEQTLYAHWKNGAKNTFDVAKDAYKYVNEANSFGYKSTAAGKKNYPIKLPVLEYIFGENARAKDIYINRLTASKWTGNCVGMASTAALMLSNPKVTEQDFGANDVYSLEMDMTNDKIDGISVKTLIEAMQTSQYSNEFAKEVQKNKLSSYQLQNGANIDSLCDEVKNSAAKNVATLIVIEKDGVGGHALLGYGIEDNAIKIYDCNHPSEEREMKLSKSAMAIETTGWSYDMGNYGTWGSNDDGCYISFVPYSIINYIWENKGNLFKSCEALHVNKQNISIMNNENLVVAELKNGRLVTESSDIASIPELSLGKASGMYSLYLPKGDYTVTCTDENQQDPFVASLSDNESSATVTTAAPTISFSMDSDIGQNDVAIDGAKEGEEYSVSLSFGANDADSRTLSGTAYGDTISISGTKDPSGAIGITNVNCDVNSVKVDDEEQETHEVIAASGKGGSVYPKGSVKVVHGDSYKFSFEPEDGYRVKNVMIDGTDIGSQSSYEFKSITEDSTLYVTFEEADNGIQDMQFKPDTGVATVDLSNNADVKLIGAVYNENGSMLAAATAESRGGNAAVRFGKLALPEKYTIKIMVLDRNSMVPLCAPLERKFGYA